MSLLRKYAAIALRGFLGGITGKKPGEVYKEEQQRNNRWYEKYGAPTLDRDTGLEQTNLYAGYVGNTNQQTKVHIAIDENGDVVYVRDVDGTVLFDRKRGVGTLPADLNWHR